MPRKTTPSFITTIPLIVTSRDEKEIDARFNSGMRLLNACLNEAEIRMNLVRNSEAYQTARKIPRSTPEQVKARGEAFNAARKAYRFSDFDIQAYATQVANSSRWIAEKVDSNTQQKLATRAFKAVERVLLGKAKSIRFKVHSRFRSMEGKTNKQGLRWKDGMLVWGKLKLRPLIEDNDPVLLHGLNSPIKYVRLLRKDLNGKTRYFAQLVNEGHPFQKPKNKAGDELVGLDLNVSVVAVVGDEKAALMPFADKVPTYSKEIATLQRQMERSRRASNPDNYEPDFESRKGRKTIRKKGKAKRGNKGLKKGQTRQWVKTKRYQKTAAKKRELERRKAAYTQSQNRKLVNDTIRIGKTIKTESVSVKGWQKLWGKAIGAKSPGFFMTELVRKAENAGGQVIKFSTQKTALSQTHLNGERIKKSLSERVHRDLSGFEMHRDLFSAFLSRYVVEDELLLQGAQIEYPRLEQVLMDAWQRYKQSASPVSIAENRQAQPPLERISIYPETDNQIGGSNESVRKVG